MPTEKSSTDVPVSDDVETIRFSGVPSDMSFLVLSQIELRSAASPNVLDVSTLQVRLDRVSITANGAAAFFR